MPELLLLRHGKAVNGKGFDKDIDRPLKDKGKRAAQRMGVWLAQQGLVPDYVLSSPAERAVTTAAKCLKAMGGNARDLVVESRLYRADAEALLKVLADSPQDAGRILLVGHNPGLRELVSRLGGAPDARFPPGALARIGLEGKWADIGHSATQLIELTFADSLEKRFPYPTPHGSERRDRPAYYYTQSAVIPYRVVGERREILIVRSSQNKHWVVPKGIAEPGLSLQQSAAQEAFEEAGIEGTVTGQALGSYSYEKWGARCTVTVFAMQVDRMLDQEAWEESHRGRKWVSPAVAKMLLKEPAMAELVSTLERQLMDSPT